MPNLLSINGAQSKPTRYSSIWNESFSSGLITQRNPLRAGKGSSLMNRLYGSETDSFLAGSNVEISNRLTPVRRPGSSIYNSRLFPVILDFYDFHIFNSNTETIKVIADAQFAIYDATGPSTQTVIYAKPTPGGQAYFQSVGNTLYIGTGTTQLQYIQSALNWTATTLFQTGNFIIDPNGNVQVAVGSQTYTTLFFKDNSAATSTTLQLDPSTPNILPNVRFLQGVTVSLSNFSVATWLNGKSGVASPAASNFNASAVNNLNPTTIQLNVAVSSFGHAGAAGFDAGTVTTGTGISGTTQPTWATGRGQVTQDGGAQWVNHGPALENWGIAAPTVAPTVAQLPVNTTDSSWFASVYYPSAGGFVAGSFPDQNGFAQPILQGANIQFISATTGAAFKTGASLPAFSTTPGGSVLDGSFTWTCQGSATPAISHGYTLGQWVVATASDGNQYFYRCIIPGTSGAVTPTSWTPAFGQVVVDGGITWQNVGPPFGWARIGALQTVEGTAETLDSNGSRETVVVSGISGSTAPTWATTQGSLTIDNTVTWLNDGPLSPASTLPWVWAYAYKNSVTGNVSTASPVSTPVTQALNFYELIQGPASTDPQVDTVVIYRSVQGGSTATLLFEDEIPNPPAGQFWQYYDDSTDQDLDDLILANVALSGNPPPAGLTKMTYHLDRIWGVVDNAVYFSAGPDSTDGNGNEQFPPANVFVFPDQVNRLYASSLGLFVFTVSDVYVIQGTTTSTFFSVPFLIGLGLPNYNAWTVNGATVYMFTSDRQMVSLDMGTGVSEVGFPIGDQFLQSNWTPGSIHVTWHISGSPDKGLYVSDFFTGWYRMYPTPAPETGNTWAPFAAIAGGISAVKSIETTPGTHSLLIGTGLHGFGPILKRDSSVFTDNGVAYDANFLLGSVVLAQPGQLAELVFLTTDSIATGTRPILSVQLDEIAPFSAGMFEALPNYTADPTQLEPSTSMYSQRFYLSQTQQPALCRSLQINVDWGTDTVQNELLSLTIFGGYSSEL